MRAPVNWRMGRRTKTFAKLLWLLQLICVSPYASPTKGAGEGLHPDDSKDDKEERHEVYHRPERNKANLRDFFEDSKLCDGAAEQNISRRPGFWLSRVKCHLFFSALMDEEKLVDCVGWCGFTPRSSSILPPPPQM